MGIICLSSPKQTCIIFLMTSNLSLTTSLKLTGWLITTKMATTTIWRRWVPTQGPTHALEALAALEARVDAPVATKALVALEVLAETEHAHARKANLGLKFADAQEQRIACVQRMDVLVTEHRQKLKLILTRKTAHLRPRLTLTQKTVPTQRLRSTLTEL